MSAEELLAAMDDEAFDAIADERESAFAKRNPYERGRAAAIEAYAQDRAESETLSELALRTLGRLRACAGATRHDFRAGFLAGLADAVDKEQP